MEWYVRKPGTERPTHDAGDIFCIEDDGVLREPCKESVFILMKFPGVDKKDYLHLLEPRIVEKETAKDQEPEYDIAARRKYKIDVECAVTEKQLDIVQAMTAKTKDGDSKKSLDVSAATALIVEKQIVDDVKS